MDVIQYILSWIIFAFFKFAECSSDNMVILPKAGQESIKRKLLQIPKEFVSGIRSLADNSHIPLMSMEYQVQIHSTISEVQLIQEFQNPILGSYIQAEFYYQTRVTQTFVSLEVYSNEQVLKGIVLDKNKQKKKKGNKSQDDKVIPSPYAEIIEDMHDIMRINLGFLFPGQQVKIVIKYLEELEREADNVWKLTLLTASQQKYDEHNQSQSVPHFMQNSTNNKLKGESIPKLVITESSERSFSNTSYSPCSSGDKYSSNENQNYMSYDWKINGQVMSSREIVSIESASHTQDLNVQKVKSQENDYLTYFSLDYGKYTQGVRDFVLIITEKPNEDINISRAFVGYDPQDTLYPYAALIRFSPLVNINPDETNSSCKNKYKNSLSISQSQQFLADSQNEIGQESEDEEGEVIINKDESSQQEETEQDNEKEMKQQPSKNDKTILIVIDDFLQNSSKFLKTDKYSEYIKSTILEFVKRLLESSKQNDIKKQLINIFLVSKQETIFDEYIDIQSITIEELSNKLNEKIQISNKEETLALPINVILLQMKKKVKKQYLVLIGTGDYWNTNEILFELGIQKKLTVYAIGVGNHLSFQLFQRIEQLNCGKTYIVNNIEDMKGKIKSIISDLNAPIFKKFTIIYDQKLVSSMTSIIDNINTLSLTRSYSLHVFFNKNFLRLIKHSKKNNINKISFVLVVTDEDNIVYKTKAKIYFDKIFKTNVFHKLAANQQIQSYLINALYKPDGYSNLSLIKKGTTAYERILEFSMRYQILSEVTAMFLLDSQFLVCSKSLDQSIKAFSSIVTKLVLDESNDEDELNMIHHLENLKKKNKSTGDSSYIIFKSEEDKKQNKKNAKPSVPEYTCTLNINPLNLNNVLIQKIEQIKQINYSNQVKPSNIYHIKKNQKGQSYHDIIKFLKQTIDIHFQMNLDSLILRIRNILAFAILSFIMI